MRPRPRKRRYFGYTLAVHCSDIPGFLTRALSWRSPRSLQATTAMSYAAWGWHVDIIRPLAFVSVASRRSWLLRSFEPPNLLPPYSNN